MFEKDVELRLFAGLNLSEFQVWLKQSVGCWLLFQSAQTLQVRLG